MQLPSQLVCCVRSAEIPALEASLTILPAVFLALGAFPLGRSGFLPFASTGESTSP